jgi:thioredoxin reductase
MRELEADVVIVIGGTGGVIAAPAALRAERTAVMSEEFNLVSGQLMAQAVPPNEYQRSEHFGRTCAYRQ